MKTIKAAILLLLMLLPLHTFAGIQVVNATVNYQHNPMGIDRQPMVSWQLKADGGETGVMQTAYQIVTATSESDLRDGRYLYDTGRVSDGHSVQVKLNITLQSSIRYYYQIRVWDNRGQASPWSVVSWFETGLLQPSDWDGAAWIGSPRVLLSPLRSSYVVDYDAHEPSVFIFGRRDSLNYNKVELSHGQLVISHLFNGQTHEDAREDVSRLLSVGNNHVRINVFASQYCRTYRLDVYLNDSLVRNTHPKVPDHSLTLEERLTQGRQATFEIDPSGGDKTFVYARLYEFEKTGGISHLRLTSPAWGTLLYSGDEDIVAYGAPVLGKAFTINKPVVRARLYVSARGILESEINGQRVGNDLLAPGWPDYRYRLFYSTYDVTALLRQGDNDIQSTLGNGWWCGFNGYQTDWQDQYGVSPSMMAKLLIEYSDGTATTLVTDGSWLCSDDGPVGYNSLQNGEVYDARKEKSSKFNVQSSKVFPSPADSIVIQAYEGNPIHVTDTLRAISIKAVNTMDHAQSYHKAQSSKLKVQSIYDFGQNLVGIPHIRLHNCRPGQKLTLRYAEMLWPEEIPTQPVAPYTKEMYEQHRGQIYTDNYRSALSTDVYICRGGEEVIEPRFTSHGFRYLQIEGLDAPLPLEDVSALVTNSLGRQTCTFETSDTLVNRLFQNILWGQRGNFLAVPTDCPQRDERLGYTGDGQIFALSSTFNYNVDAFMRRWLLSVRDDQLPDGNFPNYAPNVGVPPTGGVDEGCIGWSDAGIIVPWHLYEQYADKGLLEESYPSMKRYMDYLETRAGTNQKVQSSTLKVQSALQPVGGLGDWLSFETTNDQITNTAYFAYDALLMARTARALGRNVDEQHYLNLHAAIKQAFNATFVLPDGRTHTPKGYKKGLFFPKTLDKDSVEDTQTSYILPLKAQLFSDSQLAADHLAGAVQRRDNHLSTGFIGTPYLAPMLSRYGHNATAYALLLQRSFPSWLYPVTQGATTIWERWNSYTREQGFGPVRMNSFNHYSYGAIEEWLIQYCLGIKTDPDEPGYKHFVLEPQPDHRLGYARGSLDTMYGRIISEWCYNGDNVTYHFEVPANTTATIFIGGKQKDVGSGVYTFTMR